MELPRLSWFDAEILIVFPEISSDFKSDSSEEYEYIQSRLKIIFYTQEHICLV